MRFLCIVRSSLGTTFVELLGNRNHCAKNRWSLRNTALKPGDRLREFTGRCLAVCRARLRTTYKNNASASRTCFLNVISPLSRCVDSYVTFVRSVERFWAAHRYRCHPLPALCRCDKTCVALRARRRAPPAEPASNANSGRALDMLAL